VAVRTPKRILTESKDWRQADMFDLQRPRVAHIFTSEDAREGATAFAEKRKPAWKGR
jgi:enoyl-CoA hydratase